MATSPPASVPPSPGQTRIVSRSNLSPLNPAASLATSANESRTPTPSNSSLNLPTSPPQIERSKSRARDLLRKHYGLGLGPPTPLPGRPADPMDLDSTAFDAKAYYEQLITTSSLPTLLKRENELLSEIRQLDSERQSLVYNHHHELVAASDTIAAMKSRAESLDADLDSLRAAFSEISRLSAEVSTEKQRPSPVASDRQQ